MGLHTADAARGGVRAGRRLAPIIHRTAPEKDRLWLEGEGPERGQVLQSHILVMQDETPPSGVLPHKG